jgi:hypothetical protein
LRREPLEEEKLVLLYNPFKEIDISTKVKLRYRWLGLYRIRKTIVRNRISKRIYLLENLDRIKLARTFSSNRLKLFYTRRDAFKKLYTLERIVETLKLFKNKKKEIIEIGIDDKFEPADVDETRELRPLANDKD